MIGFDGEMHDKTNGHNGHGLANLSDDAVNAAWERCCARHLPPSNLFRLALGLGEPDEEESRHLEWCDRCRAIVERFRSEDDAYESNNCADFVSAPADIGATNQAYRTGRVRQMLLPLVAARRHDPQPEPVPEVLRSNLKVQGPVLFPNGEVAFDTWQIGRLDCLASTDPTRAEQIAVLFVDGAHRLLFPMLARQKVVLVCFGRTMNALGTRLAARLVEQGMTDVHVVLAHDFYSPTLICTENELGSAAVTVLIDVMHTGGLLERLFSVCRGHAPASIRGVVLVDQSADVNLSEDVLALWTDGQEPRLSLEQFRRSATADELRRLLRFEPNNEFAVALQEESSAGPSGAYEHPVLDDDSLFVQMVHRSGALRSDYVIDKKRYPYVINVLDLFRDQDSRQRIMSMAVQELADLADGKTCLAYHAGRAARAGKISKVLAAELNWPVIPLGNHNASFSLTEAQRNRIAKYENVVLVDAAIRTGDSLTAFTRAVDDMALRTDRRIVAFCVLDALTQVARRHLAGRLGVDIRALFRFPLSPPTERVRNWMNHQKSVLRDALEKSGRFIDIEPALRTYCAPVKRWVRQESHSTLDDTIASLDRASFDAHIGERAVEYIDTACKENKVGIIRHLPINHVIHDRSVQNLLLGVMYNSMKPSFKECAVFALGAAANYEWMTYQWLQCNRPFLGSPTNSWKSVLMIACQMKLEERQAELSQFQDALVQFAATLPVCAERGRESETSQRSFTFDGQVDPTYERSITSASRNQLLSERVQMLLKAAR